MAQKSVHYEEIQFPLDAGEETEMFIPAVYARALDATGDFEIAWGNDASWRPGRVGVAIPAGNEQEPVMRWRVRDTSGSPNTVVLAFSERLVADNRLTVSTIVPIDDCPPGLTPSGIVTVSAGGSHSIPAKSNRRRLNIMADPNNSPTLHLRHNGNVFAWLPAGASATIPAEAAVEVYNPGSNAGDVAYFETEA